MYDYYLFPLPRASKWNRPIFDHSEVKIDLYSTNVNVNTPLTQFYDLCKVIVAKKACPAICRIDLFPTCTDDPNSTALSDVN